MNPVCQEPMEGVGLVGDLAPSVHVALGAEPLSVAACARVATALACPSWYPPIPIRMRDIMTVVCGSTFESARGVAVIAKLAMSPGPLCSPEGGSEVRE